MRAKHFSVLCAQVITILGACLFVVGCSGSAGDGGSGNKFPIGHSEPCPTGRTVSAAPGHTLRICGTINQNVFEQVESKVRKDVVDGLIFDSLGGEIESSIKLAQLVYDYDIDIYVNHLCWSACSQYLLFAAPRIYTRPDSLILMHDTQASTNVLTKKIGVRANNRNLEHMERKMYTLLGVDEGVLFAPTASMSIKCGFFENYMMTGAFRVISRYDYAMPSADDAQKLFGDKLQGDWPSEERVRQKLKSLKGRPPRVRYGFDHEASVTPLEECSAGQR
jgi:hypothetical protein